MTRGKPAKKTDAKPSRAKTAPPAELPVADGPRLTRAVPVLPCADIARAVEFYAERLGFAPAFRFESHASVLRDGVEIHLYRADAPVGAACRIEVAQLRALHDEMSRQGVVQGTVDLGEFSVLDADGNRITFAQDPLEA